MTQQVVTTQFGPGFVVASDTQRGNTSYQVEGDGFSIWLTAAQIPEFGQLDWDVNRKDRVNYENSTTLPYNPQPQFLPHSGESTIQPNQHLDTQKRLTPADSVTFEERGRVDRFPKNFAPHTSSIHQAGWGPSPDDPSDQTYTSGNFSADLLESVGGQWKVVYYENGVRQTVDGKGFDTFSSEGEAKSAAEQTISEWEHGVSYPMSSRLAAEIPGFGGADTQIDLEYPTNTIDDEYPGGTNTPADHSAPAYQGAFADVQARLGDKYIDIPTDTDWSSVQARLDDDPYRTVIDFKLANYEQRQGLDPRIAAAMDLESVDPQVRQAAWADVRAKATRLRRDGNVQMEAANPTAIVATVTGDHGIYQVAVLRGSALTGSSAVSEWTCSCPWGDWAFERQHTFVGRLCSHAYAALQELRSLTMRHDKPRDWSHNASNHTADTDITKQIERSVLKAMSDEELASLLDQLYTAKPDIDLFETNRYDQIAENFKRALDTLDKRRGWTRPREVDHNPAQAVEWARTGSKTAWWGHSAPEEPSTGLNWERTGLGQLTAGEYQVTHKSNGNVYALHRLTEYGDDHIGNYSDLEGAKYAAEQDYDSNRQANKMATQYPNLDGTLTTEPGTLEPDLNQIPKRRLERTVDVETGTPYPQPIVGPDGHKAFLSEPFAGSGPDPKHNWETSEDYVREHEFDHGHDDVEFDGGNPVQPNGDDARVAALPENGLNEDGTDAPDEIAVDDPNDVVAQFQKNAGQHLRGDSSESGGQFDNFADNAKAFLRTAGRTFTLAEQQELMDEEGVGGPIDQGGLDLRGTHYLG